MISETDAIALVLYIFLYRRATSTREQIYVLKLVGERVLGNRLLPRETSHLLGYFFSTTSTDVVLDIVYLGVTRDKVIHPLWPAWIQREPLYSRG